MQGSINAVHHKQRSDGIYCGSSVENKVINKKPPKEEVENIIICEDSQCFLLTKDWSPFHAGVLVDVKILDVFF